MPNVLWISEQGRVRWLQGQTRAQIRAGRAALRAQLAAEAPPDSIASETIGSAILGEVKPAWVYGLAATPRDSLLSLMGLQDY